MRYMSRNHTSRTATVWCPGPIAYSVWALDDETGRPVVVKLKHGKAENACEVTNWGWPSRYAPKLPEKVWRAAVGDQCTQLAFDDATVSA